MYPVQRLYALEESGVSGDMGDSLVRVKPTLPDCTKTSDFSDEEVSGAQSQKSGEIRKGIEQWLTSNDLEPELLCRGHSQH